VQLTHAPSLNATADRDGITIETKGDVTFRIAASGIAAPSITAKQWNLPGMPIAVQSDGAFSSHPTDSSEAPNAVDVTYTGVGRIRLQLLALLPHTARHRYRRRHCDRAPPVLPLAVTAQTSLAQRAPDPAAPFR
jgi:hypothetical protein